MSESYQGSIPRGYCAGISEHLRSELAKWPEVVKEAGIGATNRNRAGEIWS
jgi:hypothetical protein